MRFTFLFSSFHHGFIFKFMFHFFFWILGRQTSVELEQEKIINTFSNMLEMNCSRTCKMGHVMLKIPKYLSAYRQGCPSCNRKHFQMNVLPLFCLLLGIYHRWLRNQSTLKDLCTGRAAPPIGTFCPPAPCFSMTQPNYP